MNKLFLQQLVLSGVIFLALDMMYFRVAGGIFQRLVLQVQKEPLQFNFGGAIFAYIMLFAALNYFILQQRQGPLQAFVLGLLIYGVYELTNYALLKDWTLTVVVMDTLWGGVVFALTTYLTTTLLKTLLKKV
jgi:uncharacterized membrane protein